MKRLTPVRTTTRGFTLVELMVSLVAGLFVTLAVVALAKSATVSFFEEARLATVESTLRSAAERLRQDLSRTSYMSTGNIFLARNDSLSVPTGMKISHTPGAATPSRSGALTDLQGIRIFVGGSVATAAGTDNLTGTNSLTPDAIELTGNFTTDDSYRGKINAGGNIVTLSVPTDLNKYAGDVAVARLLAGPDPEKSLRNAFAPGDAPAAVQFIARIVDQRGCHHYALVSGLAVTGPVTAPTGATITLTTGGGSPVLTPGEDLGGCGASETEEVAISPVQRVRWWIGPTTAALAPAAGVDIAAHKYDLYREILDGAGAAIAAPGNGRQVAAEYAVDLKFGITVDNPAAGVPPANQQVFDMDTNAAQIGLWTQAASLTAPGGAAPHRVRSVRFRLATRAAIPDRQQNVVIPPGGPYMSRYCTQATFAGCTRWARVRTMMSEVALLNQLGMSY